MAFLDETRRRLKDLFSQDAEIRQRPMQALDHLANQLAGMTAAERARSLDHHKAYADLYYLGRHKEDAVPFEVKARLQKFDRYAERLNAVDVARQKLHEYGGPPTRLTVQESLDRSHKQRVEEWTKEQQKATPAVGPKTPTKQRERAHEYVHTQEP